MNAFRELFKFRSEYTLWCGIERERFITSGNGEILPRAEEVLGWLGDQDDRFGYELSACQLEDRIGPCELIDVRRELDYNERQIAKAEQALGFASWHCELAPDDMPLDVYPDPTGRYQEIVKCMEQKVLLAACQVTGTHVHIGMPSHETALRVYNRVIEHFEELCVLGDSSDGRRLEVYKIMAPNWQPRPYTDWREFYEYAVEAGFVNNPRDCWHLIRISINGTIEFRLFGATSDLHCIEEWTTHCHALCRQYIES